MATLLLELALTRIFSVIFFYHAAFLAISIALFGLGVGGVLSYFAANRLETLGRIAIANAFAVMITLLVILRLTHDTGFWQLALVYFAAAVPFVLSGIIISVAIAETVSRVDRVYFADLFGAAAGCLILIPLLNAAGGPGTVLCAAVLFAASSAVWYGLVRSLTGRVLGVGLALALVALIVYNARAGFIDLTHAKGRSLVNEVFVKWNSFSRIAVTQDPQQNRTIVIDGDATTGIARFDFNHLGPDELKQLRLQGPGLPYTMRPGAKTLIIGSGGGWDVARALSAGSRDVTGVEINPLIANTIMRGKFADWSNRLYFRPDVRIFVEDGRSYVRRSPELYQVLQATLVDTWASTAAGAFALSENNLYTTEAFYDYLSHLTDDGILAFTRWGFDPPRESLRVLSLAAAALEQAGETEPGKHVMVIREGGRKALDGWGALDTVLVSRKPFANADIERARGAIAEAGFEKIYLPGDGPVNEFGQLLLARDRQQFFQSYRFDVSPVTDDRPFFFYTVQPRDLWTIRAGSEGERADFKVNRAVQSLFEILGVSLVAIVITLLLPPLLLGSRLSKEPGVRPFLLYFVCLGVGYILVQVGLIQKLVVFLGRPTYALTVVIYTMLVSSGLGSFFSRRIVRGEDARLRVVLIVASAVIGIMALVVRPVTQFGVGWPLVVRAITAALLVFPAGFLMGMPFPSGLTAARVLAPAIAPMGMVPECRRQRTRLCTRGVLLDLFGSKRNAPAGGGVLPGGFRHVAGKAAHGLT